MALLLLFYQYAFLRREHCPAGLFNWTDWTWVNHLYEVVGKVVPLNYTVKRFGELKMWMWTSCGLVANTSQEAQQVEGKVKGRRFSPAVRQQQIHGQCTYQNIVLSLWLWQRLRPQTYLFAINFLWNMKAHRPIACLYWPALKLQFNSWRWSLKINLTLTVL